MSLLLDAIARASVILALTGLATAALRRSSASARHLIWVLGLVSALLVPVCSIALPRWEVPIVRVAATMALPSSADVAAPPIHRVGATDRILAAADDAAAPSKGGSYRNAWSGPSGISTSSMLLFLWAMGAAIVVGRLLLGLAAVAWMSRRTRAVTVGPWLPVARGLAADLGLTDVRFVQSATASMPMAWGLLRASVLMPADADTWPMHRLRVVLLHELAHVKRRDCLTHVVAQIVCAAYWFNPLAWIAVRRLRAERERACDDLVLQTGTRGSDYADELLDIARAMQRQRFPAVLGGASLAMAHRSQLEGRLIAILDPSMPRRGLTRARLAAAAALCAALMLSVASVQPWAVEPAAVSTAVADAPVAQAGPDSSHARASAEVHRQIAVETRVQTGKADKSRAIARDEADGVADEIAGVVGGVVDGVVGGVVDGVVGGVAGGVSNGVAGSVARAIDDALPFAQATPTPTPAPTPTPTGDAGKSKADPRAIAALMEALKDSDADVRETALHALVQMHDARAFEPLVAALKDSNPDVRQQAAFGLGGLHDPRAIEPLMGVLRDSNPDVRQQAIFALGQYRDKRTVEPFISALKDENPDVRQQAAFALGGLRDPRAVEPLIVALKDNNPDVREQVAFALGQLRDPRAIDGLTAALKDSHADVRKQAAFALGQIRY